MDKYKELAKRVNELERMVQLINVGCLSEIRGLMITLKVKPEDFVKSVNDTVAMQVLGRNLQQETERLKAHQEPIKVKTDFNQPTLQVE